MPYLVLQERLTSNPASSRWPQACRKHFLRGLYLMTVGNTGWLALTARYRRAAFSMQVPGEEVFDQLPAFRVVKRPAPCPRRRQPSGTPVGW